MKKATRIRQPRRTRPTFVKHMKRKEEWREWVERANADGWNTKEFVKFMERPQHHEFVNVRSFTVRQRNQIVKLPSVTAVVKTATPEYCEERVKRKAKGHSKKNTTTFAAPSRGGTAFAGGGAMGGISVHNQMQAIAKAAMGGVLEVGPGVDPRTVQFVNRLNALGIRILASEIPLWGAGMGARADAIGIVKGGALVVIDYKTCGPPVLFETSDGSQIAPVMTRVFKGTSASTRALMQVSLTEIILRQNYGVKKITSYVLAASTRGMKEYILPANWKTSWQHIARGLPPLLRKVPT